MRCPRLKVMPKGRHISSGSGQFTILKKIINSLEVHILSILAEEEEFVEEFWDFEAEKHILENLN